jgi:hypothetical protein
MMNPDRITMIIKHTGKLHKEALTELFGEPEKDKEENPHDKKGDP